MPAPPQPWFDEQFTLGQVRIMPGVEVIPVADGSGALEVRNSSATPLYVLVGVELGGNYEQDRSLAVPDGWAAEVKIVEGEVAIWAREDVEHPPRWVPIKEARPHDSAADSPFFSLKQYERSTYFAGIGDSPGQGDNRPENIAVPAPRAYDLNLLYGDRLVAAPLITRTFSLNPNYDPQMEQKERERCERANMGMAFGFMLLVLYESVWRLWPLLMFAFLFLAGVWMVAQGWTARRK